MGLEVGTYIQDLNQSNPPGSDIKAQGDDHIRLIKTVLKNTFPNANRAIRFAAARTLTATTTLTIDDENALIEVDTTAGAVTVNLPTLTTANAGWRVSVTKTSLNATPVTVGTAGSELIDGFDPVLIPRAKQLATFVWTGSTWRSNRNLAIAESVLKTATATLTRDELDLLVVTTAGGDVTLTLPPAAEVRGQVCRIKRLDSTNKLILTATTPTTEKIDGADTYEVTKQYETVDLLSTGTSWLVMGRSAASPTANNTWNGTQTFNAAIITNWTVLTPAATVNIDFAKGPNHSCGMNQNTTFTASNQVQGMQGMLQIYPNGGDFTATFNASFQPNVPAPVVPPFNGHNVRFTYYVMGTTVLMNRVYMEGRNQLGFWKEYDTGAYGGGQRTVAHGLGKYPSLVQVYYECTVANQGYAVGDRLQTMGYTGRDTGGGDDIGFLAVTYNTTNVYVSKTGSSYQTNLAGSTYFAINYGAQWKLIIRVYE